MPQRHGVHGIPRRAEPQAPGVIQLTLGVDDHLDFPLAARLDDPCNPSVNTIALSVDEQRNEEREWKKREKKAYHLSVSSWVDCETATQWSSGWWLDRSVSSLNVFSATARGGPPESGSDVATKEAER
jgi:hypothetical protein